MTQKAHKKGVTFGLITGIIMLTLVLSSTTPMITQNEQGSPQLHIKFNTALAENTPDSGESGFLSIFGLDYGQNPATVLQNNATDWSSSANVHWYADSDSFDEDCTSEDPFYFVVRARFNKTHCWDDTQFIDSRCRCTLTVSGDETITTTTGTAVVSQNDTDDDFIWINFYWDDGSNGYRITDGGTITISLIKLEAEY